VKQEELELDHFEYFFQQNDTFEAINQILEWLHKIAERLNIGLSLLANGNFAPQIVCPARFNAVVKNLPIVT
jgi:hypothetical protein